MKIRFRPPATYPEHLKRHKQLLAKIKPHPQQQSKLTKEAKEKQEQDMKRAAFDLVKAEHDDR